jgi:cobalt/nickel transport system permease protein
MHMADALLSPLVGGAFWAVSGSLIRYSAKKITEENDPLKTPLMGVLGAFVFAAQMINFSIPGTGSSGHLGGGLLLAVLLGPHRAFITLASILIIQALFFADGGLLALGCNIFNLAFLPAFIAYPFIFRLISGTSLSAKRVAAGSMTAAAAGVLMGSLSVVLQTVLSEVTELPFSSFLFFMLPIHFAIGIIEGVMTWAILSFVLKTEPDLLTGQPTYSKPRLILAVFTAAALIAGGGISLLASSHPDGLEWSMAKVKGKKEILGSRSMMHDLLASLQDHTAFLPDYSFKSTGKNVEKPSTVNFGSTVSGVIGTLSILLAAGSAGMMLGRKRPQPKRF